MSLYPCINCGVIWLCNADQQPICPRCHQRLELVERDGVVDFAIVSGWALHGEPPEVGRRWVVK